MVSSTLTGITNDEALRFEGLGPFVEACEHSIARWFGIGPMAKEYEGDLDYAEAGRFPLPGLLVPQSAFLKPVADAFLANANRVSSMHVLPLTLIYWVARTTKNSCAAASNAGLPVLEALSPAMAENAMFLHAKRLIEERESWADEEAAKRGEPHAMRIAAFGDRHLKTLAQRQQAQTSSRDRFAIGGMESILFSMVTSSYAAFETLAADLWIAIVNRYPDPLATSWCQNHKTNGKKYDLKELAEFGFDISGSMGSFLVEQDHASFQKLDSIRSNYVAAFGPTVRSCFEPSDPLYLLGRVRNLIAHRGGIIDAQFHREVARFAPYADQEIDLHLRLTGDMVRDLVAAGFKASAELFNYVDQWAEINAKR